MNEDCDDPILWATPPIESRLAIAYARYLGLEPQDDRVQHANECGWPKDFMAFEAGWNAAFILLKYDPVEGGGDRDTACGRIVR